MSQPIAGVAPPQLGETTVMNAWPSIAAYPSGRFLGRLYEIKFPDVYFLQFGRLIALASIPHALALFFWRLLPFVGTRYTITNKRIVVQRGIMAEDERAVDLDRFDSVTIEVKDGQTWFDAGDVVFWKDGTETFRLEGVSRPRAFQACCQKAQMSHVGVKEALGG